MTNRYKIRHYAKSSLKRNAPYTQYDSYVLAATYSDAFDEVEDRTMEAGLLPASRTSRKYAPLLLESRPASEDEILRDRGQIGLFDEEEPTA